MAASGNTGFKRIYLAAQYSARGLTATFQHEEAFRQEVYLSLVLIPLAFYLGENAVQIALMIGSVLLVMIVEIFNSAIEAVVDRIGTERHELSGRAKDMGSAAVFVAFINVVVVWGLILLYS